MLFFPLLIASITLFSIAVTAVPQPAAAIAVGHLPLNRLERDIKADGALSNAERIARGLPLKAPVKKFEASRTDVLRPRQSEQPQVSAFYIRAQRFNGEVIGYLTFDAQNGVVLLPRDAPASSRVVFKSPRPPAYAVTIKARNAIYGGVFPVVTRDWTRADEPMSNQRHHTVLFAYDPSTFNGDAGDPVGWYNTTRHQSSNWYIPSVPGLIDSCGTTRMDLLSILAYGLIARLEECLEQR
ncbi:hypothetical protein I302_106198 [Kwoniella bestiolae CBS 10118]|uniref:Uncharacterized protein n=1 Tax=Kwoniella bestiolae CBS 10118 TaxID=1296100 RepID=A0AAJ8KBB0_9TREE